MIDIPYNIDFTFDDNLREVPENPEDMLRAIDYLEIRLIEESQDDYERMRLSGLVGTLYLIIGDYEMAEEHIHTAITSSNNLRDRQAQLRNLLRLAQVYQYRKQFELADRIFKQVIQAYEANRDTPRNSIFMADLDMAYQQYGKCLFDQGDYEIALHMFEKALSLQQDKPDKSSMLSTQHAIQVTSEKLAVH